MTANDRLLGDSLAVMRLLQSLLNQAVDNPLVKLAVLQAIAEGRQTSPEINSQIRSQTHPVQEYLRELDAEGLVVKTGQAGKFHYHVSEDGQRYLTQVSYNYAELLVKWIRRTRCDQDEFAKALQELRAKSGL